VSGGERRKIVRTAVAIGIATGTYGISFGVLSVAAGLTVAQTCAMSLLVFTGASQFAAVGVLGSGGSAAAAIAPALLLAGRNALYGLSLVSVLRGRPASRAVQSQLVIDETTAMPGHRTTPTPRASRSWPPASASSSAGTRARRSEPLPAGGWPIPRPWAWTRCSRPPSWRCWRPSCAGPGPPQRRRRAQ
jgi:AzlC protein